MVVQATDLMKLRESGRRPALAFGLGCSLEDLDRFAPVDCYKLETSGTLVMM